MVCLVATRAYIVGCNVHYAWAMIVCGVFLLRAREFAPTEDEKWVAEFEEQLRSSDGRDLQSVARDMTQAVTDPDIQASEVS